MRDKSAHKMAYSTAAAANLSKAQVWALAESIAQQLNFRPGDNIEDLVERMGGAVSVKDTLMEDPERSGSLYVEGPERFKIVVPAHTSLARDRFTIAHELGHYVVHFLWRKKAGLLADNTMMALRKGSERVEWEANWFAAAFLMPSAPFRASFARNAGALSPIANEFKVSPSAVDVRARQLGLV